MSEKQHDYVPHGAAQFYAFMKNLLGYADTRIQGWGIPPARFAALSDSFELFQDAFNATMGPHTGPQNLARREAQAATTSLLRAFVNQFLRFPPVTNVDRAEMGIPNHDAIRTDHIVVTEKVMLHIHSRDLRELVIDFWQKGEDSKAKPDGYDGAVLIWEILDPHEPAPVIAPLVDADILSNATGSTTPTTLTGFSHHTMASRTPFTLNFTEENRAKVVHIAAAWQNERGILGAWSDVISAVVP